MLVLTCPNHPQYIHLLIFGVGYYAFFNMINTPFKCYKIHNLSRGSFAYHNLAIFVQAKEKDL